MSWFKLLVTGGRNYADWVKVQNTLNPYFEKYAHEMILIEGGAQGADRLAQQWARKKGIHVATVNANWDWWKDQGSIKRAGPARNLAMAMLAPDVLVAFPGGNGTAHMVEIARWSDIPVVQV